MHQLLYDIDSKKIMNNDEIIALLREFDERVMKYYNHEENSVYYIFKIGVKYKDIYDTYKSEFDIKQLAVFNGLINKMIKKIQLFINSNNDALYIRDTRKWLEILMECI